jgi:hypothetical protein
MRTGSLVLGAALYATLASDVVSAADNCDRACLNGTVDRVLSALVKHDAASVPLAPNAVVLHNGKPAHAGDPELWSTIDSVDFHQYVPDPQSHQVAFFGVATANHERGTLFLRLAVQNGQITTFEAITGTRAPDGVPGLISPNPFYDYVLPRSQRRSRHDLIAIADSYFEGLEKHDGSKVPISTDCRRFEDGVQTSLNPVFLPLACNDFAPFKYMDKTANRLYPVVDEERGLVLGQMVIQVSQAAGPPSAPPPSANGGASPGGAPSTTPPRVNPVSGMVMPYNEFRGKPHDTIIHELFKIVDGRITEIQTIRLDRPYGWGGGW